MPAKKFSDISLEAIRTYQKCKTLIKCRQLLAQPGRTPSFPRHYVDSHAGSIFCQISPTDTSLLQHRILLHLLDYRNKIRDFHRTHLCPKFAPAFMYYLSLVRLDHHSVFALSRIFSFIHRKETLVTNNIRFSNESEQYYCIPYF